MVNVLRIKIRSILAIFTTVFKRRTEEYSESKLKHIFEVPSNSFQSLDQRQECLAIHKYRKIINEAAPISIIFSLCINTVNYCIITRKIVQQNIFTQIPDTISCLQIKNHNFCLFLSRHRIKSGQMSSTQYKILPSTNQRRLFCRYWMSQTTEMLWQQLWLYWVYGSSFW